MATEYSALFLANEKYDVARQYNDGIKDIELAPRNCKKLMKFFLEKYGVPKSSTEYFENISHQEIDKQMVKLLKKCQEVNKDPTRKLLIIAAYSGHGTMCNNNFVVLNEHE